MTEPVKTLHHALELAVATEELAADFYTHMARKFDNQSEIGDVFRQLASDEEGHRQLFKNILDSVAGREQVLSDDPNYEYLKAAAQSKFFEQDYFRDMKDISSADEALGRALGLEKATLLYYEGLRDYLQHDDNLEKIIKAEKRHVANLIRIIPTSAKFRGLDDTF
jgi:rubrerythrin